MLFLIFIIELLFKKRSSQKAHKQTLQENIHFWNKMSVWNKPTLQKRFKAIINEYKKMDNQLLQSLITAQTTKSHSTFYEL